MDGSILDEMSCTRNPAGVELPAVRRATAKSSFLQASSKVCCVPVALGMARQA